MKELTFEEFQGRIQALYHKQDYQSALELANQHAGRFPDHEPLIYYWRSTMAARIGDQTQALSLLRECLKSGIWYGEVLLRKSPSFQSLQGDPDFEALVQLNQRLRESDQESSYPLITIRTQGNCEAGDLPCALLIGLHGNASNARDGLEFWQAAASAGWLVGAPQSTQVMWKGAYVWDDIQIARREIKKHFALLLEQYSIDTNNVVIAGHSMGGELAIQMALSGELPVAGFIAIGPGGPFMEDQELWTSLIDASESFDLRGVVIVGSLDTAIPQDNIRKLVNLMNSSGIPCALYEIPEAGHNYHPEFSTSLVNALDYIIGE